MCTVSFIPTDDGIFITSNRDERESRARAFAPVKEVMNGYEITYPKDPDGGGSWIAVKDNNHCAVLFNGAFDKHISLPPYKKSRGLVFLEIIRASHPLAHFIDMDLLGIEPFTVILYSPSHLNECRWDGREKHVVHLLPTVPHVWSSVTLYERSMLEQKEKIFYRWIKSKKNPTQRKIIDLHHAFLLKKRKGFSTVSVTSIAIYTKRTELTYQDLKNKTAVIVQTVSGNNPQVPETRWQSLIMAFRRAWVKSTNWEYWPFALVYAPVIPYWIWLSLKARSFFFFSTANPSIENAGFVMEKKSSIYALIPKENYPKTILIKKENRTTRFDLVLKKHTLGFPLIAKPDVGQKGRQVKLLHTIAELENYARNSAVDFLLQEYIPYEHEVGIFYFRIPGKKKGQISGIVGKEFLRVTGDGISTVESLLKKEDRFVLQLSALKAAYGDALISVPAAGEDFLLVPYGNHSRGAKFIDLSHQINEALTLSIDELCKKIPGFYYGRLDIKFNNWEELCAGENFSIIELNGAGSEPTHMYDPSHTLFFAWREIIRHWNLLYRISRLNAQQAGLPFMRTSEGLKMLRENSAYVKLIS